MASPVAPAARATASIPVLHPRLPDIAVWWARARSPASPPVTACPAGSIGWRRYLLDYLAGGW